MKFQVNHNLIQRPNGTAYLISKVEIAETTVLTHLHLASKNLGAVHQKNTDALRIKIYGEIEKKLNELYRRMEPDAGLDDLFDELFKLVEEL